MTITVPQARLILQAVMAQLRNNMAFSDLITWEMHSAEMNDRNGFIVSEQVGPNYNVIQSTNAVADLSGGYQNTVFGSQTFAVNTVFNVNMNATDIESIKSLGDARRATALMNGTADLAQAIDYHIGKVAATAFPWSTGTYGNVLANPDDFAAARTRLALIGQESDDGLNGLLTHTDRQSLAKYIYNANASLPSEGPGAMRRGFSGELDGVPLKATNQLGRITTGTRTTATVTGASQNVNYSAVADAGSTQGGYLTQNITLTLAGGVGGAGMTVKAGEVFSITSGTAVNSYDPKIGVDRGFAQQFVVTADATANGSGVITLNIFPAMIVGDGTSTTGDAGVNNAHRTVTAAPDNGATATFLGAASTTYTPRVLFKRDAIVAHSAPLVTPYTGFSQKRALSTAAQEFDQSSIPPLMPRLWISSTHATGVHNARIDIVVQAQARDRWRGVKFFGA